MLITDLLLIDLEKVADVRKIGMPMKKISETLRISRSMLYRALENSDLIIFTEINNHDLNELVGRYKQSHLQSGERMLTGYL